MTVFLREVGAENILKNAEKIQQIRKHQGELNEDDAINLALGVKMYPLARYLQLWWRPPQKIKEIFKHQAILAISKQKEAIRQLAAFKAQVSRVEPQKQQQELLEKQFKSLERKIKLFRTRPITVLLDKAAPEQFRWY